MYTQVVKLDKNGESCLPIMNLSSSDLHINEYMKLTREELCRSVEMWCCEYVFHVNNSSEKNNNVDNAIQNVRTDLVIAEGVLLQNHLRKYSDIIALNIHELNVTHSSEMSVTLKDDVLVYHHWYRLAYFEREKEKDIIDELMSANIIEKILHTWYLKYSEMVYNREQKNMVCEKISNTKGLEIS